MTYYDEPTSFGWIITKDHLYAKNKAFYDEIGVSDETGTSGPSEMSDSLANYLNRTYAEKRILRVSPDKPVYEYKFRMYDDDGELYYTGILAVYRDAMDKQGDPTEDALMAPLEDFGHPNAGAVVIKYQGHPGWTIG